MARYRKNKSGGMPEAIFGLLLMGAAITTLNPKLREQLTSAVQTILAVLFFCSLVGLVYFIYKKLKLREIPSSNYTPPYSLTPREAKAQNGVENNDDSTSSTLLFTKLPPIEPIEWDETILCSLEWKRFEVVCKEFFRMIGFDPRETKIGADGGVDIRIYKVRGEIPDKLEAIVQCKAWNTYKVGVKLVRELFGIMAAEKIESGMIITSGEFTDDAKEFAVGKKLVLMSGDRLLQQIRKFPADKQQRLLDIALEGDYKTPTCPQCDIKMTVRENRSGRNPGSKFWGCVRYPRCRQTLVYKGE